MLIWLLKSALGLANSAIELIAEPLSAGADSAPPGALPDPVWIVFLLLACGIGVALARFARRLIGVFADLIVDWAESLSERIRAAWRIPKAGGSKKPD